MNEYGKQVKKQMDSYANDPDSVDEEIFDIQNAQKGVEVRGSLASGVKKSFDKAVWAGSVAEQILDESFDDGVLNTAIEQKLNDLEQEYAPELTSIKNEVEDARGNEISLGDRLDEFSSQLAQSSKNVNDLQVKKADKSELRAIESRLEQNKIDKDGSQQVKWANIAQDAREQISGDKVAVVGKDAVGTENLTNSAVTYDKTSFADEVSIRAKNIMENGNFSIDSNGDGLADGWSLSTNGANPRIEHGRQYWESQSENSSSGALRGIDRYHFVENHQYYIRFEQSNVYRIYFFLFGELSETTHDDGVFKTIYSPEESGDTFLHFFSRDAGEAWVSNLLIIDLTETFGSGKEPDIEYIDYLLDIFDTNGWFDGTLNLTDTSKNGIITAKDLKVYDPSKRLMGDNVYESLIYLRDHDNQALHEAALQKLKNEKLNDEINTLRTNSLALFNLKMDKESDREVIDLKNTTSKQKLILHLHKRQNEGYNIINDAYLPNAEDDFSDVKITSDDGVVLPYRISHVSKDYDVVADSRLNARETFVNSEGTLLGFESNYIAESTDKGKTWTRIPALSEFHNPNITLVTLEDTLIFNHEGYLYRSESPYNNYEQVFELPQGYSGMQIRPKAMVQHPDGEIFCGTYQNEHALYFYKSVDDGRTWELSFEELDTYQHTHAMYVDVHSDPVAVYAGVDRGGGVFKTTDKGVTWVDLRETSPDMPQATDFGVRYADPSGYRLLSGETANVGGYSLLKTTDDVNFKPVLETGASIHYIYKMNGRLFACGAGDKTNRHGVIYMSEDEGETWKAIYNTSPLNDTAGANDGFRDMEQLEDQLIIGVQGTRSPLRIFPEGSYAEIIVDVPAGTDSVIVESGYAYPNIHPIYNDTVPIGEYFVKFNLNEGGRVIKEEVSGQYFDGDFEWEKAGKHLSYFYPYITSPAENLSILTRSLNGYKLDSTSFDTSEGITISLWGNIGYNTNVELFSTDSGYSLELYNGNRLRRNSSPRIIADVNDPIQPESYRKLDLIINPNGESSFFVNGQRIGKIQERVEGSLSELLLEIHNSSEMTMLRGLNDDGVDCIQHFSIRRGAVPADQLHQEYNSYITDNVEE